MDKEKLGEAGCRVVQTLEQGSERLQDLHLWSKIPPEQGCEQPDSTTKPALSRGLDLLSPEVPLLIQILL